MDYKDIRKLVEKDPELKALNIQDYELLTAYRYLKLKKSDDSPNYIPILKRNGSLEIIMIPTEAFDQQLAKRKNKANVGSLDTVNYLLDANMAEFKLSTKEREEAYLKASRFIDLMKEGKPTKGLYIYGRFGTGKTYLLSAIVDELAKSKKVLFIYFPDLVRSIKSSFSTNDLEVKVNALKTADVLIFDDMGSENMTPWFRDEILAPVLQFRLASGLPLLISSNLKISSLIDFMATESAVDRTKAGRIIHRIFELTDEIKLDEVYSE